MLNMQRITARYPDRKFVCVKGKVRKVEVSVDERVNVTFREAMI